MITPINRRTINFLPGIAVLAKYSKPETAGNYMAARSTTPSPDGTVVTTTGHSITSSSGEHWSLVMSQNQTVGLQIAVNGRVDPVTAFVVRLVYHNGKIFQQNSYGGWWDKTRSTDTWQGCSDPFQSAAPAQASAAGYNHLAFNEDFSTLSVSNDLSGNYNWYPKNPYSGVTLSTNEWSIANNVLTLTTDNTGYSFGVSTINSYSPAISTPGAIVKNQGKGLAFHYGYFECSMKFDPNMAPKMQSRTSWPSWWSSFVQAPDLPPHWGEIDFLEAWPIPQSPYVAVCSTVHEWTLNPKGGPNINVQNWNNDTHLGPKLNYSTFNTYGCLWQPNLLTWYVNDVATVSVPIGPGTPYPSASSLPNYLVLGTGKDWPSYFKFVRVWQ